MQVVQGNRIQFN